MVVLANHDQGRNVDRGEVWRVVGLGEGCGVGVRLAAVLREFACLLVSLQTASFIKCAASNKRFCSACSQPPLSTAALQFLVDPG